MMAIDDDGSSPLHRQELPALNRPSCVHNEINDSILVAPHAELQLPQM